jgi:hypothetical protein
VNDESIPMIRELETALNLPKLFTHTPVRSQITQEKLAERIPALYLRVIEKSV